MPTSLKSITIGTSTSTILPKELLARMKVQKGEVMKECRETFKNLAK